MKLNLTDEQTMLAQSVARLVADNSDRTRPNGGAEAHHDPDDWRQIAELGWLSAGVSESAGGFGGAREMAVVIEGAASTPLAGRLTPVFVALNMLEESGGAPDLLAEIMAGQKLACGLLPEMASDLEVSRTGSDIRLSGRFPAVAMGDAAQVVVLALDDITVLIDADAEGIGKHGFRAMDGTTQVDLALSDMAVRPEMILASGDPARTVQDRARLCHAATMTAECTGLCKSLFDATLTYVKQREQFGQPIGRFQALQHRLADMFIALEEIRSLALATARAAEEGNAQSRPLSQAVTGSIDRALHIAKEAIQLHGGVGMTDDLPLGAGLRRIKMLQVMLGGGETHRQTLLSASG
ncbi:acyl-CoA dehydrogenase family protein [Aquicoccus sp.]|uniref:acyl-CoA dehydrogenase family protein n=1 Tax=Aquicoccus sp. TaxID=2055851 RepID=UPI00356A8EAC